MHHACPRVSQAVFPGKHAEISEELAVRLEAGDSP